MPTAPGGIQAQLDWFNELVKPFEVQASARSPIRPRCCAFREARGDWVRPGIMLYGCSPFADQSAEQLGLKPVMTLTSEIIATQHLQPGRARRLRLRLRGGRRDDHRHRRLRLCRRLSAPRAHRHAGAGQRQAHAHRWTGIDGHDQRRHLRHPRGLHRLAGHAVGRGPFGRRGRGGGRHAELRAALQADARACRSPKLPDGKDEDRLRLLRVRRDRAAMVRRLPVVRRRRDADRDRRPSAAACAATAPRHRRCRWPRSSRATRSASPPASASSTARWAAAWWRGRWCCSAAIRASASPRCCCRRLSTLSQPVLYVTGEESAEQVALRARRLGLDAAGVRIARRDPARAHARRAGGGAAAASR